jgi:hypothetical protein
MRQQKANYKIIDNLVKLVKLHSELNFYELLEFSGLMDGEIKDVPSEELLKRLKYILR